MIDDAVLERHWQAWRVRFLSPTGKELTWIGCVSNLETLCCEWLSGEMVNRMAAHIATIHGWSLEGIKTVNITAIEHLGRAFLLPLPAKPQ